MQYLLLEKFFYFKIYGPVSEDKLVEAERFFKNSGYKVKRVVEPPTPEKLNEWRIANYGGCVDGCFSVAWDSCPHGARSWMSILKKIR